MSQKKPDLGLNRLTDDQLLELLQQLCQELGNRDPFLVSLAQAQIFSAAELLELRRKAMAVAVREAGIEYAQAIQGEADAWLREELRKGTVRLLPPGVEARLAAQSGLEAKMRAIDEIAQAILCGKAQRPEGTTCASRPDCDSVTRDDLTEMMREAAAAQGQQNLKPPSYPPTVPVTRAGKGKLAPWI
jgi:hypothetical protein